MSIDLGGRTTKAVELQRNGHGLVLSGYAMLDAPSYQEGLSPDRLAEHLKNIVHVLGPGTCSVILAIGVGDSVMRHVDLPGMPLADMRQVLKNNSKNYLQQDLAGDVFDCTLTGPGANGQRAEKGQSRATRHQTTRAGGRAKKQLIEDIQAESNPPGWLRTKSSGP